MTEPDNDHAALDQELRQEQAEIEAEIRETQAQIARLLTLLAWLYRQIESPKPIADQENWPDVYLLAWPDTRGFAFQDQLLFDLARHQAAADLRSDPDLALFTDQDGGMQEAIAALLIYERPSPSRGRKPGYLGIRVLTKALLDLLHYSNSWGLPLRLRDAGNPWSFYVAVNAFAEALADRLNEHPLLADLPDAITADKIRSSLQTK